MKRVVLFTLAVLCLIPLLCACGNSSKLVGVWDEIEGDGMLYFAEDNTGMSANVVYTSESFKYEEKSEKLTFIGESTVETEYAVDTDILTITLDGKEYRYKLVELSEDEFNGYFADNSSETTETPGGTTGDKKIAESIVGAWRGGDGNVSMIYVFYEDGTGAAAVFPFTYTVKDGVISVEISANGSVSKGSGRYDLENDLLYIDNGESVYELQRTEIPEEFRELAEKKNQNQ